MCAHAGRRSNQQILAASSISTHFAAFTLASTSCKANSAARARSRSSSAFCLWMISSLTDTLLEGLLPKSDSSSRDTGGRSLITPVDCQFGLFKTVLTGALSDIWTLAYPPCVEGERWSRKGVCFELEGVEPSLFPADARACRRVTLPLIFRISSTLCRSSGGFAFLSLMYRSRWRPRDDDVKA